MNSTVQRVALVFGVGFLIAALAGFAGTGMSNMDPDPTTAPRALGLFPVNVLHNLVHLAFAVWGLVAARSFGAARTYCRISGVLYLVLVVAGFVAPDGFGLIPLGGNDIWLHLALGAPLAYFGFTTRDRAVGAPRL
jgi:hypothetical protein